MLVKSVTSVIEKCNKCLGKNQEEIWNVMEFDFDNCVGTLLTTSVHVVCVWRICCENNLEHDVEGDIRTVSNFYWTLLTFRIVAQLQ